MDSLTRERAEAELAIATRRDEDPISAVVGSPLYSVHHRFADLHADLALQSSMRAGGLNVSRFYFEAGVVVDVISHPVRFAREIAFKRAYCARKSLRYVLVSSFDDESVRSQLSPVRLPTAKPQTTASIPVVRKPRTRKVTS